MTVGMRLASEKERGKRRKKEKERRREKKIELRVDRAINSCTGSTRRGRAANLLASQPAFSATSAGGPDRNGRKISTTPAIKTLAARRGAAALFLSRHPEDISLYQHRSYPARYKPRLATSRPYFFLSTSARCRGLLFGVAIRRRPICRTGTRIGRHSAGYLGTERGTITNINIQRPRSLWWYGVSRQLRPVAKNLTSLQHPPWQCQENVFCFFVLLALSLSFPPRSLSPPRFSCGLAFYSPSLFL